MSSKEEKIEVPFHLATLALRSGVFHTNVNENSPALFLNSSYVFESAEQAQNRFSGAEPGNIYSRFTNPSVIAFEERLAAMEGGEKALATASGMSAITTLFLSLLSQGDHIVISQSVFGSTLNVANDDLTRFGIGITTVQLSNLDQWREAIQPNTKLLFAETPANPTLEMVDLAALSEIARAHDVLFVVDNVFCTPVLQKPLALGADMVVHSATKFLDGQGRVLGGAIIGEEELLVEKIFPFIRNTGPTLSAFNAWVLFKGMETLSLRVEKQSANTETIFHVLRQRPGLEEAIIYPGSPQHPQHALAKRQMSHFGSLVCLDLESIEKAHRFMNHLQLATITANLGDVRTLVTHPATTTHSRISAEARKSAGISDGMVRFSIGLEDPRDIVADIEASLERIGY